MTNGSPGRRRPTLSAVAAIAGTSVPTVSKVLRGQATATGSYFSRLVDGSLPELDRRLAYDPKAARALLKEAGYPEGFSLTLDCVNASYRLIAILPWKVSDKICARSVSAMAERCWMSRLRSKFRRTI